MYICFVLLKSKKFKYQWSILDLPSGDSKHVFFSVCFCILEGTNKWNLSVLIKNSDSWLIVFDGISTLLCYLISCQHLMRLYKLWGKAWSLQYTEKKTDRMYVCIKVFLYICMNVCIHTRTYTQRKTIFYWVFQKSCYHFVI